MSVVMVLISNVLDFMPNPIPIAIAVGTEDEGLTEFWMSNADLKVKIPMLGKVNSLNVSIAAALITYEAVRQRNAGVMA